MPFKLLAQVGSPTSSETNKNHIGSRIHHTHTTREVLVRKGRRDAFDKTR